MVCTDQIEDPGAERHIGDAIIERRDKIVRDTNPPMLWATT